MNSHEVIFNVSGQSIDIDIIGTNRLEAFNAAALKNDLTRLVNKDRLYYTLNLENIDFIDSLGLGVLVSLLKRIKTINGHLAIKGVNHQVRKLMELTQLTNVFHIENSALSPK